MGGGGSEKFSAGVRGLVKKTRLYCIYSVTKESQERIYSLITRAILREHFKLVGCLGSDYLIFYEGGQEDVFGPGYFFIHPRHEPV